jgi:hypothetical protein
MFQLDHRYRGAREKRFSVMCKRRSPPVPFDERRVDDHLKLLKTFRDGRLADGERFGSPRKASRARNLQKAVNVSQPDAREERGMLSANCAPQ